MKQSVLLMVISVLILITSCGVEQPTPVSTFNKRNIDNDPNWVEFHDYDILDGLCYNLNEVEGGLILNSVDEYKEVFHRAADNIWGIDVTCRNIKYSDFVAPDIDFENRSLIIYSMSTQPLGCDRKIYYNTNTDEYFYLLITPWSMNWHREYYNEALSLPKITDYTRIKFDTIALPIF